MLKLGIGDIVSLADIDNFDIVPLTLVRIGFPDDNEQLITDAPYDVVYNSETYSPGPLRQISPPAAQGTIDRDLFSVVLDDNTNVFSGLLENASTGVTIEIVLAFDELAGGVIKFLPIYNGQITSFGVAQTGDTVVEQTVTISCSGPLTKLYQLSPRSTSPTSQAIVDATDTCFAQAFRSDNEIALQWGGDGGTA